MKLIEAKAAKEFVSTLIADPILKMAVNAVLDKAPGFDLVYCKDCKNWRKTGQICGWCTSWEQSRLASGYCHCGEREDHEKN